MLFLNVGIVHALGSGHKCTHIGAVRVGLVEGLVLDTLSCLPEGESGHIGNT